MAIAEHLTPGRQAPLHGTHSRHARHAAPWPLGAADMFGALVTRNGACVQGGPK